LTPEFWLRLCGKSNPTQREQFLWLTIHHVRANGLAQFTISRVAKQLGYSVAMVNHHFGSRDGLIAECAETVYEIYAKSLIDAVSAAERTPRARLDAFLSASYESGLNLGGWSVVVHYPNFSFESPDIAVDRTTDGFEEGMNSTLIRITQLVIDLRKREVSDTWLDGTKFPTNALAIDADAIAWAANIGFVLTGMRAWMLGRHSAVSSEHQHAERYEQIVRNELTLIVDMIPIPSTR
jgi:AcrR family transcriptional regulator